MRHLCSCAASRHGGTIPPSPTHPTMVQPRDLYTTTPIPASALHTSHRLVWFPLGPCLVTDEQHTYQTWSNIQATEISIAKGTRDPSIEYFLNLFECFKTRSTTFVHNFDKSTSNFCPYRVFHKNTIFWKFILHKVDYWSWGQ